MGSCLSCLKQAPARVEDACQQAQQCLRDGKRSVVGAAAQMVEVVELVVPPAAGGKADASSPRRRLSGLIAAVRSQADMLDQAPRSHAIRRSSRRRLAPTATLPNPSTPIASPSTRPPPRPLPLAPVAFAVSPLAMRPSMTLATLGITLPPPRLAAKAAAPRAPLVAALHAAPAVRAPGARTATVTLALTVVRPPPAARPLPPILTVVLAVRLPKATLTTVMAPPPAFPAARSPLLLVLLLAPPVPLLTATATTAARPASSLLLLPAPQDDPANAPQAPAADAPQAPAANKRQAPQSAIATQAPAADEPQAPQSAIATQVPTTDAPHAPESAIATQGPTADAPHAPCADAPQAVPTTDTPQDHAAAYEPQQQQQPAEPQAEPMVRLHPYQLDMVRDVPAGMLSSLYWQLLQRLPRFCSPDAAVTVALLAACKGIDLMAASHECQVALLLAASEEPALLALPWCHGRDASGPVVLAQAYPRAQLLCAMDVGAMLSVVERGRVHWRLLVEAMEAALPLLAHMTTFEVADTAVFPVLRALLETHNPHLEVYATAPATVVLTCQVARPEAVAAVAAARTLLLNTATPLVDTIQYLAALTDTLGGLVSSLEGWLGVVAVRPKAARLLLGVLLAASEWPQVLQAPQVGTVALLLREVMVSEAQAGVRCGLAGVVGLLLAVRECDQIASDPGLVWALVSGVLPTADECGVGCWDVRTLVLLAERFRPLVGQAPLLRALCLHVLPATQSLQLDLPRLQSACARVLHGLALLAQSQQADGLVAPEVGPRGVAGLLLLALRRSEFAPFAGLCWLASEAESQWGMSLEAVVCLVEAAMVVPEVWVDSRVLGYLAGVVLPGMPELVGRPDLVAQLGRLVAASGGQLPLLALRVLVPLVAGDGSSDGVEQVLGAAAALARKVARDAHVSGREQEQAEVVLRGYGGDVLVGMEGAEGEALQQWLWPSEQRVLVSCRSSGARGRGRGVEVSTTVSVVVGCSNGLEAEVPVLQTVQLMALEK